jgi:hypothetical protein
VLELRSWLAEELARQLAGHAPRAYS